MTQPITIQQFLNAHRFAVAGASTDRSKYGNRILLALIKSGRNTIPINPNAAQVEGIDAAASVADLPTDVEALSVVTPPAVTRQVVQQAIAHGIRHIWMQPGAEDESAAEAARAAGINVIDDGSCILVALSLEQHRPK